jgi:hypothetical protein
MKCKSMRPRTVPTRHAPNYSRRVVAGRPGAKRRHGFGPLCDLCVHRDLIFAAEHLRELDSIRIRHRQAIPPDPQSTSATAPLRPWPCNQRRGDRTTAEADMPLRVIPMVGEVVGDQIRLLARPAGANVLSRCRGTPGSVCGR